MLENTNPSPENAVTRLGNLGRNPCYAAIARTITIFGGPIVTAIIGAIGWQFMGVFNEIHGTHDDVILIGHRLDLIEADRANKHQFAESWRHADDIRDGVTNDRITTENRLLNDRITAQGSQIEDHTTRLAVIEHTRGNR